MLSPVRFPWMARVAGLGILAFSSGPSASLAADADKAPVRDRAVVAAGLAEALVCHYDFDHPLAGDPAREADRGNSGTDLELINGGAAMRVPDAAFPGGGHALQTRQVNPTSPGNDDWKAGRFEPGGLASLAPFAGARAITLMGWVKPEEGAPNPALASATANPADAYPSIGFFGLLTGPSDGHYARALLEVLPVAGTLRVVALGRRLDDGATRILAATAPWQTIVPAGRWTHLTATFDFQTGTMALYRDGEALDATCDQPPEVWRDGDGGSSGIASPTAPAGIKVGGSHPQNTRERNTFNGRLDELMFFNRALGADEVRRQYAAFVGRPKTEKL